MQWNEMLKSEMDAAYRAAAGLAALVDDLEWKPSTGDNWMTTGQLLQHLTDSCGGLFQGFVTGEWKMPDGTDIADVPEDEMMPPASAMPAADGVEAVLDALRSDQELSERMLEQAADRMDEPTPVPWAPDVAPLGQRLLMSVNHLNHHKSQLFYYLKLQGKPVNTMHYYGMAQDGGQ